MMTEILGMDIIQIIEAITLVIFLVGFFIFLDSKLKKNSEPTKPEIKEVLPVDLKEGMLVIDFLERIIKEKYTYHLYLTLMPIYMEKKVPEKKTIDDLKEKIYVSVVGSLTRDVKKNVLCFFTDKGIEMLVYEKIIILMNETDFQSTEKFMEPFKEITVSSIDKIM